MKATVMYRAFDVRVETVPDADLIESTDALVVVTRAAICGSDLWPYQTMEPSEHGRRMGHEFIGVVDAVGEDVRSVKRGDLVVSPFLWSDGTGVFCREGLQTSCLHGGRYGDDDVDGGQGEAVRVPQADGTLVPLPVGQDDALMASLLTLADVMGTGHHAAPARAYIEELLPDVLEGRIEPGRVFDREGSLDDVPDGYRAMNDRESIKFLIEP
jgi:threonine dehydrogenase-like Zn-dependent dehydrogenase